MPRKSALRKVAAGVALLGGVALMSGCATEQSRTLEVAKVASAGTTYNGPRSLIAVGTNLCQHEAKSGGQESL